MKLLHRYQISRQAKCTYVDLNMNATTAARFQHYPTAIDATIKENIQHVLPKRQNQACQKWPNPEVHGRKTGST